MHRKKGFTLVEILVVMTIIGILATIVLGSVNDARMKANNAKVKLDLKNLRTAIALLEQDTGKWPNGCDPSTISNPEVMLDTDQAGIKTIPTAQNNGDGCIWTNADIAKWDGPYMQSPTDPWGKSYHFDPDYRPYENCSSETTLAETVALVSSGPNKSALNAYDCDDIYLEIQ